MHVIVLGGMARVGKTEVADILEMEAKLAGMNPKRISFSTPVKEEVAARHDYDDPRKFKEDHPETYRRECQKLGAGMREEQPDYWVNKWLDYAIAEQRRELIRKSNTGNWEETVLIVDDCRYLNELQAVKKFEATTVFIYAGNRKLKDSNAAWRAHESEELAQRIEAGDEELSDWFQWGIYNDKTRADLNDKLEQRMPHFLGEHPTRFCSFCKCPECQAFRYDIQAEELIEGFREAIRDIKRDKALDIDIKARLLDLFEQAIDDLASGNTTPRDMFKTEWWLNLNPDAEEPGDDNNANNSDS